jgi:hypothetical protein
VLCQGTKVSITEDFLTFSITGALSSIAGNFIIHDASAQCRHVVNGLDLRELLPIDR